MRRLGDLTAGVTAYTAGDLSTILLKKAVAWAIIYAVLKNIKFHSKAKGELITVKMAIKYAKMGHSILEAF